MPHILDNMIWNAITTGNRNIAQVSGNAGCYLPDVAPFAGVAHCNDENIERLFEFLPAGRSVAVALDEGTELNETKWRMQQHMDCCQMVYEQPVSSYSTAASSSIVRLNMEHVPQMLELTAMTKPGPFHEKTIVFGNYFGIFIDGKLAAMTGQRMHPVPFMEVSAVCTHPDFRGRGYAKTLMLHVMKIILDNSFTPFLHVLTSNTTAIQLYEAIGFRLRRRLFIDMIRRL